MAKYFKSEYELERFLDKQIAADEMESMTYELNFIDTSCYITTGIEDSFDDINFYRYQ